MSDETEVGESNPAVLFDAVMRHILLDPESLEIFAQYAEPPSSPPEPDDADLALEWYREEIVEQRYANYRISIKFLTEYQLFQQLTLGSTIELLPCCSICLAEAEDLSIEHETYDTGRRYGALCKCLPVRALRLVADYEYLLVLKLSCGHRYHLYCIFLWALNRHGRLICPLCRNEN